MRAHFSLRHEVLATSLLCHGVTAVCAELPLNTDAGERNFFLSMNVQDRITSKES